MPPTDGRPPRIAVFAGPNATILNTEPLVTSNKARLRAGLAPRTASDGRPLRFDALRPQRLARPVTVFVEQFSAHPLERDAAELYGPPDGYLDARGAFHAHPSSAADVPVYAVELRPEDGLYPLPYMALQADGRPWEDDASEPDAPRQRSRQPFYPDAARLFEEIDRLQPGDEGVASHLASLAEFDFYRAAPPAGYARGLDEAERSDAGQGPIEPEDWRTDFFPYRPPHLLVQPTRRTLARLTNLVHRTLDAGHHTGGLWLEGSPHLEETAWWLNLLVDTTVPLAATASQRPHGAVGNDGDRNVIDAVRYLTSPAWSDDEGRDSLGVVVVVDQQIITARAVQKADARPGGYLATGGHGGVLGSISSAGRPAVSMRPLARHTWRSDLRRSALPREVEGVRRTSEGALNPTAVRTFDEAGDLRPEAMPLVTIVKGGQYASERGVDADGDAGVLARMAANLRDEPLAGFVAEGSAPFGTLPQPVDAALRRAAFSGFPVVRVGRGNADGLTEERYAPFAVAGRNLTATKARLLLMAALLRLGALPPAHDPERPTTAEMEATRRALDRYQELFDRH